MLPLPLRRVATVNCVLLRQSEGWLLVDCGMRWDALEYGLGLAGLEPADVSRLVLTHLHCDHGELAYEFVKRTGCELIRGYGREVITDRLRDPRRDLAERVSSARRDGVPERELRAMVEVRIADYGRGPYPIFDRVLTADDELVTEVGNWQVILAQGHSANQIVLYEPELGYIVGGDAAYPTAPFIEWGSGADPLADYLASLDRIANLEAGFFIPGHGRPGPNRRQRFQGARKAIDGLIESVLGALAAGDRSAYEITLRFAGADPDPDHRQSTFATVIAILEHLQLRGLVRAELEADNRRWSIRP